MLRVVHKLEANIKATDSIKFEISFVPLSKWDNVDDSDYVNGLGEDAGRCELNINDDNPRFWDATLTDIYYKCTGTAAVTNEGPMQIQTKCSDPANTYNSNSVLSESSSNN